MAIPLLEDCYVKSEDVVMMALVSKWEIVGLWSLIRPRARTVNQG